MMRNRYLLGGALGALAIAGLAHANLMSLMGVTSGGALVTGGSAPTVLADPEIIGLDYPNNGTTTTLTGTTVPLTASNGKWTGSPTSYTYNWHFVGGSSLGTAQTLSLNTSTAGVLGKALQVDVTAHNSAGTGTRTSYWFGPIESATPSGPPEYETLGTTGPTTLPVQPTNFLENGHAIYPGCTIPPVAPDLTPTKVFYFDPINGRSITQMTSNSDGLGVVATGSQGHAGHPFKDQTALFNGIAGYNAALFGFGKVIPPGSTIYVEPGLPNVDYEIWSGVPEYSTSDGTATGTVVWTWIMSDPASSRANANLLELQGGGVGFIFKSFNQEPWRLGGSGVGAGARGSAANPVHDVIFEDIHVSSWRGHSDDPWPGVYPNSGGQSNGLVTTAAAILLPTEGQDPGDYGNVTMAQGDTSWTPVTNAIPLPGKYLWPSGWFRDTWDFFIGAPTGMPLGTKVVSVAGLTAANYVYSGGTLNGFLASDLTPLTFRSTLTTAPTVPEDDDGYYLVAATPTTARSVYTWNHTSNSWTSLGIITSATYNVTDQIFWVTTTHHLAHWTGSVWEDRGLPVVQLGPCDPVADALTGCPANGSYPGFSGNIPGCDPLVTFQGVLHGGCPVGTVPAWSGATRAISGETLSTTGGMLIVPAGYFSQGDWGTQIGVPFALVGSLDTADSLDPTNPNVYVGMKCISLKDNWAREVNSAFSLAAATNAVEFNNRVKLATGDGFDIYSAHRVWSIHNYASDPSQVWLHQDALQYAVYLTTQNAINYDNAAVDNEFLQWTDTSNWFPSRWQGLGNTDSIWQQTYIANNVIIATTFGIGGQYNVVVNNTVLNTTVEIGTPNKGSPPLPPHALSANNIGMGNQRALQVPNFCTADGDIIETNVSIPNNSPPTLGVFDEVMCSLAHSSSFTTWPGPYEGVNAWSPVDWASAISGVSPLFMDYESLSEPVPPAPGGNLKTTLSTFPCVQLSILPWGCQTTGMGVLNLRPNPAFSGTTIPILGIYQNLILMPQTGAIGDAYVAATNAFCGTGFAGSCGVNLTWPEGVYVRANHNGDYTQWAHTGSYPNPTVPPYNPGIIGAGTALGAQDTITDHDGLPWDSPHSIGAYALH